MITNTAKSKNGVPVRLTGERWVHISTGHPEMADYYYEILETIEKPAVIYKGTNGELIAINDGNNSEKFIVVVYKETSRHDGFVITAYISNKKPFFEKKEIIWKQ